MLKEHARNLRKRLTPQEVRLWARLRDLKRFGFHFRRQAPIGPYIVDFVCFKHRMVVEADGGQHASGSDVLKDAARDAFLSSQGFRVLRFWNSDIDHYLDGVIETIFAQLKDPHPDRLEPVIPPHKGEGEETAG